VSQFSQIAALKDSSIKMTTYQELIAQKKMLDQQIEDARKLESKAALASVQQLVKEFGFTAQQVFPWKPDGKKSAPAKYHDPESGKTWTGRGKPPNWILGTDRTLIEIT
jgi:DNA-binding protein H-NS